MRKVIRASLLVLALSYVAHAGHIANDAKPAPTPQPLSSSVSQESSGGDTQNTQANENTLTEIALNLLESVLSLF